MSNLPKPMPGVREYSEEEPVELCTHEGRLVVMAHNEAGYNCTQVDLLDLLEWLAANESELLRQALAPSPSTGPSQRRTP